MALILGPAGFGLAGLYNSIAELSQNVAGLGVNSSGVRQIAEAVGTGEVDRIALTVAVLRRTSLALGLVGTLTVILFSRQISLLTFATDKHAAAISLLSAAVFFKLVCGGQTALIQGMRRIADLAKMNILGAMFGAFVAIGLVYLFGEKGIVPYLIAVAAMSVLMSWWYSRRIQTPVVALVPSRVRSEIVALLKLGFAFMVSSLMTLGAAYAIRVIVLHRVGIEGTGLYQSAWTLGGLYVGFILQAMAADFYPRLTGSIHDHAISNRLVNEQARVGLLLAGPGVIATLTFAPLIITLLYSSKFAASVPILRWICLGATLQVITWPMGFIIVAKGKQNLFIFNEVAWAIVSLVLAWVCIARFGLNGAGISFFLSYVFHGLLIYPIVRRLSGFRWSRDNLRTASLFLPAILLVFCVSYFFSRRVAIGIGSLTFILVAGYSIRWLLTLVNTDQAPRPVRKLAALLEMCRPINRW